MTKKHLSPAAHSCKSHLRPSAHHLMSALPCHAKKWHNPTNRWQRTEQIGHNWSGATMLGSGKYLQHLPHKLRDRSREKCINKTRIYLSMLFLWWVLCPSKSKETSRLKLPGTLSHPPSCHMPKDLQTHHLAVSHQHFHIQKLLSGLVMLQPPNQGGVTRS